MNTPEEHQQNVTNHDARLTSTESHEADHGIIDDLIFDDPLTEPLIEPVRRTSVWPLLPVEPA